MESWYFSQSFGVALFFDAVRHPKSNMHVKKWKMKIYDLLLSLPSVVLELGNNYFASINSKITVYKSLREEPAALLELAIKLNEHNSDLPRGILDCATRRAERPNISTIAVQMSLFQKSYRS